MCETVCTSTYMPINESAQSLDKDPRYPGIGVIGSCKLPNMDTSWPSDRTVKILNCSTPSALPPNHLENQYRQMAGQ